MGWLLDLLSASATALLTTGLMLAFLTALEVWLPRARGYTLVSRGRAALFWIIGIPLGLVLRAPVAHAWTAIRPAEPLVTLDFLGWLSWTGPFKWLLAAMGVLLVTDFFGYWFHRVQHGPLWPFHAVHHSIEDLHVVSSYRHPADAAFQFVLMSAPMTLIPFGAGTETALFSLLIVLQLNFIHSPVRFTFGPLRYVLVDNAFHRIHHSLEPRHFGKNYGTLTPVWDVMFGTAYFPAKDEWPETGLADMPEPRSVRAWLDLPLRLLKRRQVVYV
jgi:sterol desaturase/sphingolipid hydroxylase (fatty acid hydroxylase superfamily)